VRDAHIAVYYVLVYVDTRGPRHKGGAVGRGLRASGWGKAKGRSPLPWEVWELRPYGRAQEGVPNARPLPNLTPSPLNVVNVHRSVFKAHPLVRAARCLEKILEGNDNSLEAHGGQSRLASPIL